MELFELIQTLNRAHGPSGDEGEIREVIRALAEPYADEITADTMGSLIVHRRGKGPKLLLAAHMDSIGFVVTHIEKEGFLRVGQAGRRQPQRGGLHPRPLQKRPAGGLCPGGEGRLRQAEAGRVLSWTSAPGTRRRPKQLVQVGDTAVYDTPAFRTGDLVVSPYLDDRISCAVLLSRPWSESGKCPNDLYLVFTAQEEVGLRGATDRRLVPSTRTTPWRWT